MKNRYRGHSDYHETVAFHYDYRHDPFIPPLRVVSAGNAMWAGSHRLSRNNSDLFGIEMITEGDSIFTQNGREYLVKAGEVYFLRRGCAHEYKVGPSGFLHKRYCVIEGGGLEPLLRAMNLFECDYVKPFPPATVSDILKRMNIALKQKLSGFTADLSFLAYRLLLELGRNLTVQYPEPVRAAVEFMQQNLHRSLECDRIRERSGLSTTHFNRLFHHFTGVSPMQFFISQRIAWARHLLTQTSMSVKEVANAVGFEDALYFSARFKKYTGYSPKKYRMENVNETK